MILLISNKQTIKKLDQIIKILFKKDHLLDLIKELCTKVVGEDKYDKVRELKFGQMVQDIRDNLKMIKQMGRVNLFMLMVIYMMEPGQMIKLQVLEFIIIIMEQNMKVNG